MCFCHTRYYAWNRITSPEPHHHSPAMLFDNGISIITWTLFKRAWWYHKVQQYTWGKGIYHPISCHTCSERNGIRICLYIGNMCRADMSLCYYFNKLLWCSMPWQLGVHFISHSFHFYDVACLDMSLFFLDLCILHWHCASLNQRCISELKDRVATGEDPTQLHEPPVAVEEVMPEAEGEPGLICLQCRYANL